MKWLIKGLVLGLIFWAIGIHISLIALIPDPIFAPDSFGYAFPGISHFFGGPFYIESARTPVYPLFLYASLMVTRNFYGVLWVQHGVALLMGACAAALYRRHGGNSVLSAAVLFFLTSSLPLTVVYAHSILTEILYGLWVVLAFVLALESLKTGRIALWLGLGVIVALAALTRPTGRCLLGLLVLMPLLAFFTHRKGWIRSFCAIAAAAFILLGFSAWNYIHKGFFGLDRMRGIALFCCSAQYLEPEDIPDPDVRTLLVPVLTAHKAEMRNGAWVDSAKDGPLQILTRHYPESELHRIVENLGYAAVLNHPGKFLLDRFRIIKDFLLSYAETPLYYLIPEASYFVYQGIDLYRGIADKYPQAWGLLRHRSDVSDVYFKSLRFVPTGRPSGHLPAVPRSDGDVVYHYAGILRWWKPLHGLIDHTRAVFLVACVASGLLLAARKSSPALLIAWWMIMLHAAATSLAAWQDPPRFVYPVLPLYYFLSIAGIEYSIGALLRIANRRTL